MKVRIVNTDYSSVNVWYKGLENYTFNVEEVFLNDILDSYKLINNELYIDASNAKVIEEDLPGKWISVFIPEQIQLNIPNGEIEGYFLDTDLVKIYNKKMTLHNKVIEHWEEIKSEAENKNYEKVGELLNSTHFPFCKGLIKSGENTCKGCPIFNKTRKDYLINKKSCRDTPLLRISELKTFLISISNQRQSYIAQISHNALLNAIDEEIKFLESLSNEK